MKSVAIVGAGVDGLRLWEALVRCGSVDVVAFVDADARLHGRIRAGLPIHPPAWLHSFPGDLVVASSAPTAVPSSHRVVHLPAQLGDEALASAASAAYPDPLAGAIAAVRSPGASLVGIFGTGAGATKVWEAVTDVDDLEPAWFADNDTRRQGREFLWLPVIAPAAIPSQGAVLVIIGSMSRDVIRRQLHGLGVPDSRVLAPDVSAPLDRLRTELRELVSRATVREVFA